MKFRVWTSTYFISDRSDVDTADGRDRNDGSLAVRRVALTTDKFDKRHGSALIHGRPLRYVSDGKLLAASACSTEYG